MTRIAPVLLGLLLGLSAAGGIDVEDAERVQLKPAILKAGKATVLLDLSFEDGWKLNPDAPFKYSIAGAKPVTVKKPKPPVKIPITVGRAAGKVEIAAVINYCRENGKTCRIKTVLLVLPVEVAPDGKRTVTTAFHVDS